MRTRLVLLIAVVSAALTFAESGIPHRAVAEPANACGPDQMTAVQSALAQVPPPHISGATWTAFPSSLNSYYDPCADLSAVVVSVEGATPGEAQKALLFHRGTFVGTGAQKDYPDVSVNRAESARETVVLNYEVGKSCAGCRDGITTIVRYQWDGAGVQMLDALPPSPF